MDISFNLDLGELRSIVNKLPKELKQKVTRNAVRSGARIIKERAKELAPYDNKRVVGIHLRDAIIVKHVKGTNDIHRVGVKGGSKGAPHGHLLEFGTVKMAARPFLLPAFIETKPLVAKRMIQNLSNGVLKQSRILAGKGKGKGKK